MACPATTFEEVARGARGHFRLLFYEALFRLIDYVRRLSTGGRRLAEASLARFPFLAGYYEELRSCLPEDLDWRDAPEWWREQIQAWAAGSPVRLPMRALAQDAALSHKELVALVMTGMVEEDIRFSSMFAALQEPLPARRPCLGLLSAVMAGPEPESASSDPWSAAHRLLETGLVLAENQEAPRAEWILRVPPALWGAMSGRGALHLGPRCHLHSRREFPPLKALVLDASLRERLCHLPAVIARRQVDTVILRGMAGSGRRTMMGALARALRRDLLFVDQRSHPAAPEDAWPAIGPLCALLGALPVLSVDPAPGETVELPPLTAYHGPVGVVMRREGSVSGPALERAITLTLPLPAPDQRRRVWEHALDGQAGEELETITHRFLLPLGSVRRAAGIAAACAALERRERVTVADVQVACRSFNRQVLDTLAQRVEVSGRWSDLIVNEATAADLRDLERRCRHRERILAHLGPAFRHSINPGVRALFHGPSGTGKTLAAKILAAVLQTDIYRVDLAAIVSKYVGETEKNLGQLLARAEELDVILLIDEGDAVMSQRTDVKSSNDRYANLETNYLLQRMESYAGIILITTNAGNRIDAAFQRRLDVTIPFHPPDPYERLLIWQQHLPASHRVNPGYLREIAQQCALTGGQIRNAALYAALLAVDAGRGGEVVDPDIEVAVQSEYRKAGASCPIQPPSPTGGDHQAVLTRFLAEVR